MVMWRLPSGFDAESVAGYRVYRRLNDSQMDLICTCAVRLPNEFTPLEAEITT